MNQNIYGILYEENSRKWYALVNAAGPVEAVDVLWDTHTKDVAFLDADPVIIIQKIEGVALVADLPFPEVAPEQPSILMIAPLERS